MHEAAIGIDDEPFGRQDLERPPNAIGDDAGRFDVVALDVDDPETQRERQPELVEQLQVLVAAPRELERDRMHLRFRDRRKQIAVAAFPRRLSVSVAVTDVQRESRVDRIHHRVDRAHRPRQIFREAGIVRLVDLQIRHARPRELAQLEVHHAREVEREGFLGGIVLILNALDERMRARDGHLRAAVRKTAEEPRFLDEAQRARRKLRPHDAVVVVVVEPLRPEIDLHAGQPLREVVDHVVALELAVRNDVDAGDLLVLDRALADRVVHLVEVVAADAPLQVIVLRPLQPLGHRVAADHRRVEKRQGHGGQSRCVV